MSDQSSEPTQVDMPAVQPGAGGTTPPPGSRPSQGSTPPPPSDKWPWIIGGVVAVIVLVVLALLLFGGDDDDDDGVALDTIPGQSTTTSTSSTTTTSTSTTTTTAPPATTTTTTASPPVTADPAQCREAGSDPADPDAAALTVFVAWTRRDVACARELMSNDALDELFVRDGTGAQDDFQGCSEIDEGDPHIDCAFTFPGGSTHYLMNFSDTDGWQVFDVNQVAD